MTVETPLRAGDPSAELPNELREAMVGLALLGDYLLPFELASMILLAVMIGAAYLAKSRRKDRTSP